MTILPHPTASPLRIVPWIAALTLSAAVAAAQTEVEQTVDASADGMVEVTNISGSVVISGWDRNEVRISGTLERGVEQLDVDTSTGRVEIEVDQGRGYGGAAHLEIRVPTKSRLTIGTVSAEITVDGVDGNLELESVSGDVEVTSATRSLDVQTVSGRIDVAGGLDRVTAESVNGTITLEGGRDIEASNVSGSLRLEGLEDLENAELEVVSGRISFEGMLAANARMNAESQNGSIDLTLPESTSARFEISTFNGRIRNELGPPARRVGRYTHEQELEFTMGSGDARVRVESFNGSITLRSR